MRAVISDTSVLSYLLQVDDIRLLRELYTEVLLPRAVYDELSAFPGQADGIDQRAYLTVVETADLPPMPKHWPVRKLDLGERDAFRLASLYTEVLLLADDGAARRTGAVVGVKVTGLFGVYLAAKRAGLIEFVRPRMETVIELGFYLQSELYKATLRRVGE